MDNILNVAAYIVKKYAELTGETGLDSSDFGELKLQKLLYFTQRECFAVLGRPAFAGDFEGWVHGPVNVAVRNAYRDGTLFSVPCNISEDIAYIANNAILEYGAYSSWKLRDMSHNELSWINARKGLAANEYGNVVLKLEDIQEDAKKVRPYDHVWDMYYDEFEDAEECRA